MRKYRDSSCADPRDKVFALLGLVEIQSKGRKILPNYWRSVYQVYVDVMECCSDVAIVDRLDFGTMVQDMFGLSRLNVDEYLRAQFLGYLTSESLLLLRSRCLGQEQANSTIAAEAEVLDIDAVQLGILSEARLLPPLRHETYRNATGLRYLPPRMIWAEDPGGRRCGFACQDARRGDLVCKSELDLTLIVREHDEGYSMIGKAVMLNRHLAQLLSMDFANSDFMPDDPFRGRDADGLSQRSVTIRITAGQLFDIDYAEDLRRRSHIETSSYTEYRSPRNQSFYRHLMSL